MADTKQATPDAIGEVLRNRILFIGGPNEAIPQVATNNGVQVYSGYPNDLIKELKRSLASRSGPDRTTQEPREWLIAKRGAAGQWINKNTDAPIMWTHDEVLAYLAEAGPDRGQQDAPGRTDRVA